MMIDIEDQITDILHILRCGNLRQAELMLEALRLTLVVRGYKNA